MKRCLLAAILLSLLPFLAKAQQTIFTPICSGTNDTAAFQSIITGAAGNPRTIRIPYKSDTSKRCALNTITIPSNISLDNTDGSGVKVNSGQNVIDQGPRINPDSKTLFFGPGTATISGGQNLTSANLSVAPASAGSPIVISATDVSNAAGADKVVRAVGTALPSLTLNANNITGGTLGDARLSANVPLLNNASNQFTGYMGLRNTTPDSKKALTTTQTGLTGGGYIGVQASVTGTDSDFTGYIYTGGSFTGANNTSANIGDHNLSVGVRAFGIMSGTGRNDNVTGVEANAENIGTGVSQDLYGVFVQTQNNAQVGQAHGVYVDMTQFGSLADTNQNANLFEGKYRHLSTGGHALNVKGLALDNWTKGTSTVDNSYAIYITPSVDIGTNRKAIYSTSTSDSVLMGTLGLGTLTPRRPLDVLATSQPQLRLSYTDNSVYSDFTVGSGGTLLVQPTGNFEFGPLGSQIDPSTNYQQNLGQLSRKYLTLHAAELWVETLVAQSTLATIGGRILVGPTTTLFKNVAPGDTTIDVKTQNLASGDRVYLEANGSVEFMAATNNGSIVSGGFRYNVTRDLDGSGANQWYAGDAVFNTGTTGSGFIDLYSVRGVKSASQAGPTIVGNIRNSSTYNDWSEHWAIGNLNGLYGYGANTPGIGLGQYLAGKTHVTIDSTNGYRIFNGLSTVIGQWDSAGNIIVGQVASGQDNIRISSGALDVRNNTTARIHLASDGSGYLANSAIAWDTSGNLTVTGNATISGFSIGTDFIRDAADSMGMASTVTAGDDVRFWAGNTFTNRATAPFRVTEAGALVATSATITGSITSTTGTIGGFTIGSTSLLAGSGATTVAMDSGGTNPAFYAGSATPGSAPFRVTNAGALTSTNATITGSITASSGSITGPLTVSGASGSIALGTTPPTSASAGTGIWLDRTGLYGLLSNVVQAKMDATTGAITAGGGKAVLDVNGVTLKTTTGYVAANALKFERDDAAGTYMATLNADRSFGTDARLNLEMNNVTGKRSLFQVSVFGDTGAGILLATFNPSEDSSILIDETVGLKFTTGGTVRMTLPPTTGNIKIAGTATRGTTEGTNHLDIFDGTAPVGTLANGTSLYSTAGELRVMDAAGNATLLSPHDLVSNEWIFFSKNTVTGKVLRIDMERLMKAIDAKLGGGFIHEYMESPSKP